ncbi:hypothetical protein [Lacinutrix undariae]
MNIKTGIFTYFFLTIWSIGFGIGFISMYSNSGIIRIFGNLTESSYLNSIPFLIIGILAMVLFFGNLIFSYWVKENKKKLIIRNLFKKKEIDWTEISEVNKFKRINLPQFSIIKTKSGKKYYIHCNYEGLKKTFYNTLYN